MPRILTDSDVSAVKREITREWSPPWYALALVVLAPCVIALVVTLSGAKTVVSTTQTRKPPDSPAACAAYARDLHVRAWWSCEREDCFCVRPVQ